MFRFLRLIPSFSYLLCVSHIELLKKNEKNKKKKNNKSENKYFNKEKRSLKKSLKNSSVLIFLFHNGGEQVSELLEQYEDKSENEGLLGGSVG